MIESLTLQAQEEKIEQSKLNMNIENTLNQGTNILKINNIPNPYLDSEILLSESINKDKKHIILKLKRNFKY